MGFMCSLVLGCKNWKNSTEPQQIVVLSQFQLGLVPGFLKINLFCTRDLGDKLVEVLQTVELSIMCFVMYFAVWGLPSFCG